MKDNFSKQSGIYAQYRPEYPQELFDCILSFTANKETAWDCGTGNGQSAKVLAKYFEKVIATDISQKQLDNAEKEPNIFYSLQPAEQTNIASGSIDLITVAQSMHWFNFEKFYTEAERVANKNCVIAIWCYSLLHISEPVDEIIEHYHYNTLGKWWDAERKYVDDEYRNIPFPYKRIDNPGFCIEKNWALDELEGYFNTWSALQKFITAGNDNPVPGIINAIKPYWGSDEKRKIIFPVHLLLGVIK
jgi:hypothetical protein